MVGGYLLQMATRISTSHSENQLVRNLLHVTAQCLSYVVCTYVCLDPSNMWYIIKLLACFAHLPRATTRLAVIVQLSAQRSLAAPSLRLSITSQHAAVVG
jgi:hypothetical protein